MNIELQPVQSREKAMRRVAEKQAELKTSKWHKLVNGDFGQSRVNEGKMMLLQLEQQIKQLEDIANHTPEEPTIFVQAFNAYNERETLKSNGFRWDGADKSWGRTVKVADFDALMIKIGAVVDDAERWANGL